MNEGDILTHSPSVSPKRWGFAAVRLATDQAFLWNAADHDPLGSF
jgi:hypothetical protein